MQDKTMRRLRRLSACPVLACVLLALPCPALAWTPGTEGSILYANAAGAGSDPIGFHIWSIQPDGLGNSQLTHGRADIDPSWAPSGREFVFSSLESFDGGVGYRLRVAQRDGSDPRAVTSPPVDATEHTWGDVLAAWSPDGSRIAFVRTQGDPGISDHPGDPVQRVDNIWVMNANGSHPRQITNFSYGHIYGLAWSPDSRQLAFEAAEGRSNLTLPQLMVMDASPSAPSIVRTSGHLGAGLDWSPAGILVTSTSGVLVLSGDSSGTVLARTGRYFWLTPAWAPDATRLSTNSRFAFTFEGEALELASFDGGPVSLLVSSHPGFLLVNTPAWGPALPRRNPEDLGGFVVERRPTLGTPTIPVRIHCPNTAAPPGCLDILTVSFHHRLLASVRTRLQPGSSRTLSVHLGTRGRQALRAGRGLAIGLRSQTSGRTTIVRQITRVAQPATLGISCPAPRAEEGSNLTVSGSLRARLASVANRRLGLMVVGPDGLPQTLTAPTNGNGRYSISFRPQLPGRWVIQTVWDGDVKHAATPSDTCITIVTAKAPPPPVSTTLSLSCPGKGTVKSPLAVSGSLLPGFAGARITLYYTHQRQSGTESFSHQVATDATGAYTDSIVPDDPGQWYVQAAYPGDAQHDSSKSTPCSTNVEP